MRRSVVYLAATLGLVAVPAAASADETASSNGAREHMRSPALFGTGLASAIVGGVAMHVGAGMVVIGTDRCIVCDPKPSDTDIIVGTSLLVTGLVMLAIGIPLAISGGRKINDTRDVAVIRF